MVGYHAIKTGAVPHIIPEHMIRRFASAGWVVLGPIPGSDVAEAFPLADYENKVRAAPVPSPESPKPKRKRGRPRGSRTRRGIFAAKE